jgi:hypothetical protein
MRRRLAMLLSATLVAGIAAVLVPASPASAGVHVCGGVGTAELATGLTYPETVTTALPPHPVHSTVQQPRTTGFLFTLDVGTCANSNAPTVKTTVDAVGVVSGWCGLSSGSGNLALGNNPRFAWVGVGGTLVLTGGVVGVVNAVPDTLAGSTCNSNAGATDFLVNGAVVASDHCTAKTKTLTTTPVDPTLTTMLISPNGTPVAAVSTHTGPWHVWTKACVPVPVL